MKECAAEGRSARSDSGDRVTGTRIPKTRNDKPKEMIRGYLKYQDRNEE